MNKEKSMDDLVQIVKRLAHSLKKAAPNNDLPDIALDYLKRKNFCGSPFRIQACREADREMAATTSGSEMINAAIQALNTEPSNAEIQMIWQPIETAPRDKRIRELLKEVCNILANAKLAKPEDVEILNAIYIELEKLEKTHTAPVWEDKDFLSWIDAEKQKPPLVDGKDYSANVWGWDGNNILIVNFFVEFDGWHWANTYGDVWGEGEFDDDYDIKFWQPIEIPEPPEEIEHE